MVDALKLCVLLQLLLVDMIIGRYVDNEIATTNRSSADKFATITAHTIGICEQFQMIMENDAAFEPYIGDVTVIMRLS